MKKIMFSFIFLLPLFLFLPKVSADTITITLPNNWESVIENDLPTMQTNISTYATSWPSLVNGDYVIYCRYDLSWCSYRLVRTNYVSNISSINYTSNIQDNALLITLNTSRTYVVSMFGNSSGNWSNNSCSSNDCPDSVVSIYNWPNYSSSILFPLYSTFDIGTSSSITFNTFIFTDGTWSYTLESGFTHLPTLKELYDIKSASPPTPEDETPLLTSFYTLAIDRLSYLLEEFSSNYLYLSIFCIFLFVLIIYFIHRRLKL